MVIVAIAVLGGMSWLPEIDFSGFKLRKVDLLSQLHPDANSDVEEVEPEVIKPAKPAFVDSCRAGVECIDDYSTHKKGMEPLYEALNNRNNLGRAVRIAMLGDSYIEGDILSADLRQLLQEHYGGSGVGLVPMMSDIAGFRRSVRHFFDGWNTHTAATQSGYNAQKSILSGVYFTNDGKAYTDLRGQQKYYSRLDTCSQSSVYFISPIDNTITVSINGGEAQTYEVTGSEKMQKITVDGKIGRVRYNVARGGNGVEFFGATMDAASGVVVDNFSLRGCSGTHIAQLQDKMLSEFDQLRHYDLVILMYGLNVANDQQTNYSKYGKQMQESVAHIKRCMPNTGILIVGVGDREQRVDGEMRTMRGIRELMAEQQRVASEQEVAFWNLYVAMGGSGSISKMVNGKPRKANLDYTHINFLGGRDLAELLFDAIDAGFDNYKRRLAYEAE